MPCVEQPRANLDRLCINIGILYAHFPPTRTTTTRSRAFIGATLDMEVTSRDGSRVESVGDYVLQDVLGTGSFGHVVLGVHRKSRARVAVKVLSKDAADDHIINRISSEVSTMEKAHVGCPFIVRLHEVLVSRHYVYLVVEYAAGGELFKALFKPIGDPNSDVGHPAREQRARIYFQQLVIGLHWCHQQGVAHRDLKPQNLLLSLDGVLKIADFGLAASFNNDPSLRTSTRSLRHTMCGSPLYMAPEMLSLRTGCAYNAVATDVWGCGGVLYAMLLGGPPFPAVTFNELVALAMKPHANLNLEGLSRSLCTLIRALLRADPKQRYSLPEVAQHPWFQTDLKATLARTPNFRPPADMNPVAATRTSTLVATVATCSTETLVTVLRTRSSLTSFITTLLARSRAKVDTACPQAEANGGEAQHHRQPQAARLPMREINEEPKEEEDAQARPAGLLLILHRVIRIARRATSWTRTLQDALRSAAVSRSKC